MSAVKLVYFLRHGETQHNKIGVFSGRSDIPLNETGISQAQAASLHLIGCGIQEIWSSPLQRARQTSEIVARQLCLDIEIVNELTERNYGEWEGRSKVDINRDLCPPHGETEAALYQRAEHVIIKLLRSSTIGPILFVSHSGFYRAIHHLIYPSESIKTSAFAENGAPILLSIPTSWHR